MLCDDGGDRKFPPHHPKKKKKITNKFCDGNLDVGTCHRRLVQVLIVQTNTKSVQTIKSPKKR